MSTIKPPDPLVIRDNKTEAWKLFKRRWNNYALLSELEKKSKEYQVAMFENCLADDAMRIMNSFTFTTPSADRTVKEIMEKFEEYAIGELNETMERYAFYKRAQQEGEDFENFLMDVRTLSQTCQFCERCIDSMVRDRILLGIYDNETRAELLKVRKLDLSKCLDICRAAQSAKSSNQTLQPDAVHYVRDRKPKSREIKLKCKYCDYEHVMKKEKCPAYGKKVPAMWRAKSFCFKVP